MEHLTDILLALIAAEGGYIAYRLRDGRLPWLASVKDGNVEGELPNAAEAKSLGAQLDYLGCAARYALEAENQRFASQSKDD